MIDIHCCDNLELLQKLTDNHIDLIYCDITKVLISKDVAQSTQRRLEKALSKARISYE